MNKFRDWHEEMISAIMGSSLRSILSTNHKEQRASVEREMANQLNVEKGDVGEYRETLIFGIRGNARIHIVDRIPGDFNEHFLHQIEYLAPNWVEFTVYSRRPATPTSKNRLVARSYAFIENDSAILGELEMEDRYIGTKIGQYLMEEILQEFKGKGIKVVKGIMCPDDEEGETLNNEFYRHASFEVKTSKGNIRLLERIIA